jgi:hypothetical protein
MFLFVYLTNEKVNYIYGLVGFMAFNATFNNIAVISWWSVLLVEYQEKTTRPVPSH